MIIIILAFLIIYFGFCFYLVKYIKTPYDFHIYSMILLLILIVIWVILSKYFNEELENIIDFYLIRLNVFDLVIFAISFITSLCLNKYYRKLFNH